MIQPDETDVKKKPTVIFRMFLNLKLEEIFTFLFFVLDESSVDSDAALLDISILQI